MFDPESTESPPDELDRQYADAMDEWFESEDAQLWDTVVADGLDADEMVPSTEEPGR